MSDIEIRAAREADIAGVARINQHYILNTVMTFHEKPLPVESYVQSFHNSTAAGLPYLVAVRTGSSTVLGYAYAGGFRVARSAYRFTVELSLFCDPEHTGSGIGSRLLKALIGILKEPATYLTAYGGSYPEGVEPHTVRHLMAVMAVDEAGKRGGLALKEFYESFGFVHRSHLIQVGYKFDKWIDVMELQLSFY